MKEKDVCQKKHGDKEFRVMSNPCHRNKENRLNILILIVKCNLYIVCSE